MRPLVRVWKAAFNYQQLKLLLVITCSWWCPIQRGYRHSTRVNFSASIYAVGTKRRQTHLYQEKELWSFFLPPALINSIKKLGVCLLGSLYINKHGAQPSGKTVPKNKLAPTRYVPFLHTPMAPTRHVYNCNCYTRHPWRQPVTCNCNCYTHPWRSPLTCNCYTHSWRPPVTCHC